MDRVHLQLHILVNIPERESKDFQRTGNNHRNPDLYAYNQQLQSKEMLVSLKPAQKSLSGGETHDTCALEKLCFIFLGSCFYLSDHKIKQTPCKNVSMRTLFPATNHIGNDYLPWKSLFASMKFIDGLDSKYTLKNEDISKKKKKKVLLCSLCAKLEQLCNTHSQKKEKLKEKNWRSITIQYII